MSMGTFWVSSHNPTVTAALPPPPPPWMCGWDKPRAIAGLSFPQSFSHHYLWSPQPVSSVLGYKQNKTKLPAPQKSLSHQEDREKQRNATPVNPIACGVVLRVRRGPDKGEDGDRTCTTEPWREERVTCVRHQAPGLQPSPISVTYCHVLAVVQGLCLYSTQGQLHSLPFGFRCPNSHFIIFLGFYFRFSC